MVKDRFPLTVTNILAAASQYLEQGQYRSAADFAPSGGTAAAMRLFEDPYSVVAVAVFHTWSDLRDGWTDAQADLVGAMSRHIDVSDAKAWEGYLVLLTGDRVTPEERAEVTRIRHDTTRIRKLVATGDDLSSVDDIQRTLLPVLPFEPEMQIGLDRSPLERLPDVLAGRGMPEGAVRVAIDAFSEGNNILEQLSQHLDDL